MRALKFQLVRSRGLGPTPIRCTIKCAESQVLVHFWTLNIEENDEGWRRLDTKKGPGVTPSPVLCWPFFSNSMDLHNIRIRKGLKYNYNNRKDQRRNSSYRSLRDPYLFAFSYFFWFSFPSRTLLPPGTLIFHQKSSHSGISWKKHRWIKA